MKNRQMQQSNIMGRIRQYIDAIWQKSGDRKWQKGHYHIGRIWRLFNIEVKEKIHMNNFFEKTTLYDWQGYMIPGTLCVVMFGLCFFETSIRNILSDDVFKDYTLYLVLLILVVGYIVGICLTQIGEIVFAGVEKLSAKIAEGKKYGRIGYENIGYENIKKALLQAKVIDSDTVIDSEEKVSWYMGYIYGEIQTNPCYMRIHNYASMELTCKNLSIAILVSWAMWSFKCGCHCMQTVAAGIAVALLCCRWDLFNKRKLFYAAAWFTQLQLGKQESGDKTFVTIHSQCH